MRVRTFEMPGVADGDLRNFYEYLLESGGFEFRAGGTGFFVLVRERFNAAAGSAVAQVVMASREDEVINVDALAAGGDGDSQAQLIELQRATELIRGFADRHDLTVNDI